MGIRKKNELLDKKSEKSLKTHVNMVVSRKTSLEPNSEKSPTNGNFEIFDHDPQLDIKFWNP